MKLINYLKAFYYKYKKNNCGTFFYYNGCDCKGCDLLFKKEMKEFYQK